MPRKPAADSELAPHGTPAAARRHYRRGEKPCEPCRGAANRDRRPDSDPWAQNEPEVRGAIRNGVPVTPYEYRARSYSWAEANIRRAEAIYGRPEPDRDWEAG